MALQMTVKSGTGLVVENAYIRIDNYSCFDTKINAVVRAYVSRQAVTDNKTPLEGTERIIELHADYSDDAPNTKKQIYDHMKVLEDYKDAVDVLE